MNKRIYLDMTDNSCTAVFIKNTEIVPAGTTIYAMSAKEINEEYNSFADKYDINFIFDNNIPAIDFYSIPQIDIMATDSFGGFIGTVGEVSDLDSKAQICYIDNKKNCFIIASDFNDLLNNISVWKEKKILSEGITLFGSKQEAMKIHEFVDLTALQEESEWC